MTFVINQYHAFNICIKAIHKFFQSESQNQRQPKAIRNSDKMEMDDTENETEENVMMKLDF